ncbi:hypothetical protein E2562_036322, partial [Oryza meyeriana var. granulata]
LYRAPDRRATLNRRCRLIAFNGHHASLLSPQPTPPLRLQSSIPVQIVKGRRPMFLGMERRGQRRRRMRHGCEPMRTCKGRGGSGDDEAKYPVVARLIDNA